MPFEKIKKYIHKRLTVHVPADVSPGELRGEVIKIAWPALTELFLIQLCVMLDTIMAGRMLGPWAIASVAYCTQPRFIMLAVFAALNTGSTALIARARGEENPKKANLILGQNIMMSVILGAVVTAAGYYLSESMVIFMGADEPHIIKAATDYMKIQMAGFLPIILTMSVTAALRGIGRTKIAMVYNLLANIVSVILNFFLIQGFWIFPRMEVAGASLATVIGHVVAFVIAAFVILNGDDFLRLRFELVKKIDVTAIKQIVKIGVPAMAEQIIMRIGMLIYTLTITSLGSVIYATHQIVASIFTMTFMTGQAFGIAATSLLGQSLGREREDLARAYTLECRRYSMLFAVAIGLVFIFFGEQITMFYTLEETIILESAKILMIVAFLQPLQSSQLVLSGALRGAGDTKSMAVITFIGIILVRPALSYFFIRYAGFGLLGAWLAMGLDQSSRSLFSYLRFKSGKWIYIKI